MGNRTRMKFSRFNGLLTTRRFWLQVELIDDCMYGICQRLAKNKVPKMLKTVHPNSSSSMADIRLRSLISLGIPMIPGSFVPYQRIILCKCGKWQRIFTTTRKWMLLHQRPNKKLYIVYKNDNNSINKVILDT